MDHPHLIEQYLGAKVCATTWHVNYLIYTTTSHTRFYYPHFTYEKVSVRDMQCVAHTQLICTEARLEPQFAGFKLLVYHRTSNTSYTNTQEEPLFRLMQKVYTQK